MLDRRTQTIRFLRIFHSAMLVASVGYVGIAEFIAHPQRPVPKPFYNIMLCVGFVVASASVLLWSRMKAMAVESLRAEPGGTAGLVRWRMAQILGAALAEMTVLFGLVMRFNGATTIQAAPFYGAGLLLLFMMWPGALPQ